MVGSGAGLVIQRVAGSSPAKVSLFDKLFPRESVVNPVSVTSLWLQKAKKKHHLHTTLH